MRKLQKRVFEHNLSPQYCVSICTQSHNIICQRMTLPFSYAYCLLFIYKISQNLIEELSSVVTSLDDNSSKILNAANTMESNSNELFAATQQQAASLQETSASISEISAMIERSTENIPIIIY